MTIISSFKQSVIVAICLSFATSVFADGAPVYDVDSYPPQFDGQQPVAVAPGAKPAAPEQFAEQQPSSLPIESTQSLSTDQRLARLEQQLNNSLHSDVTAKVGDMQSELQALRGQLETLSHQVQELQDQQKKMYSDLDKRVNQKTSNAISADSDSDTAGNIPADTIKPKAKPSKVKTPVVTHAVTADKAPSSSTADQPNVAEEQQIYQSAYNFIKAKKYNEAASTLQNMLQKYPSGQFAANAHYWLGELYGLMGKNDLSLTEFETVVKNYPDSPKVADAQLKLGLIYAGLFKWPDAKSAFKKVINTYPGTSSARLASEQMKQIKLAGH